MTTTHLNVEISLRLHQRLKAAAKKSGMKLYAYVEYLINQSLKNAK